MTLTNRERLHSTIAAAKSCGKGILVKGDKYTICETCGGAGLLPPLLPGDGWAIQCSECHGFGKIKICIPNRSKFGPLSDSLEGGETGTIICVKR